MNEQTGHRVQRESLGAYVLGHLPDEEAERVRVHVAQCDTCATELAELRPAAAALGAAMASGRTQVGATAGPSSDLAARIESSIRSEERHVARSRPARTGAIAMLSAAAAAAVLVVGLRLSAPETSPAVPLEAVAVVNQGAGVQASADLVDHTWGVEVKLLASGLRPGGRYAVTVLGEDGKAYPAGAFVGTGAKPVKCNLNAGVLRSDAAGFVVRDEDGLVVLRSTFPA